MGCFNTQGFYSGIDIEIGDAALFICSQYAKPLELKKSEYRDNYYKEINYSPTSGSLTPLTFPVIGEYDSYGRIENIKRTPETDHFEELIGDTLENFIEVIYNITYYPHSFSQEYLDKYIGYKKKLGLYLEIDESEVREVWEKYGISKKMSFEKFYQLKKDSYYGCGNQEICFTLDHAWVYDVLGEACKDYATKDYIKPLFGDINLVWANFGKVWTEEELKSRPEECIKFSSFLWYLSLVNSGFSVSYGTGQEVPWKALKMYTDKLKEYVDHEFKKYYSE